MPPYDKPCIAARQIDIVPQFSKRESPSKDAMGGVSRVGIGFAGYWGRHAYLLWPFGVGIRDFFAVCTTNTLDAP